MKQKIDQLKENFEKLKAVGELYEDLMSKQISNEKEKEEALMKYNALKNQALRLSLDSKKIIQKIEKEDMP